MTIFFLLVAFHPRLIAVRRGLFFDYNRLSTSFPFMVFDFSGFIAVFPIFLDFSV